MLFNQICFFPTKFLNVLEFPALSSSSFTKVREVLPLFLRSSDWIVVKSKAATKRNSNRNTVFIALSFLSVCPKYLYRHKQIHDPGNKQDALPCHVFCKDPFDIHTDPFTNQGYDNHRHYRNRN